MKILAALFSILGVMALILAESSFSPRTFQAEAVATNYGVYRDAVNNYALSNSAPASGEISTSLLRLPSGWNPIRNWSNRLDNGHIYVWGSVNKLEAQAIRDLFLNSYAIGINRNGKLFNKYGTGVSLPPFIPEGCIVSVIKK
ncbi:type IV pilus biogenesis protein PilM [Desulfovibrio sp. JC022]|uniref:type IV pilus biogenesis protein PilM n=1 Tax=Desulfovibrio sp. JC022 TaxID=2593642 RepID=UPI0013D5F3E6|nr:type IV pilus biogenesis protein PilM [Desulfovibrio sp. JC022]NDV23129.1 pilus assembly protein PilM [Desulfovibrio sp. JC022]